MNRRIALTSLVGLLVAGAFAGSAAASSPDGERHKLCIVTPGDHPILPGYCITWEDPKVPPTH